MSSIGDPVRDVLGVSHQARVPMRVNDVVEVAGTASLSQRPEFFSEQFGQRIAQHIGKAIGGASATGVAERMDHGTIREPSDYYLIGREVELHLLGRRHSEWTYVRDAAFDCGASPLVLSSAKGAFIQDELQAALVDRPLGDLAEGVA